MIESTFILLKGIGEVTERRLWDMGVTNWSAFLARPSLAGISSARKTLHDDQLASAQRSLQDGHTRFFSTCLKPRDHWRLFGAFQSGAVYLDIETTGGPPQYGEVTVVGLYGGGRMTTLVLGETLTESRLRQELSHYDLIISFFGSVFDIPYLRAKFPTLRLDQPHIDLCFASRRIGLGGGLKHIETLAGIERPADIVGLDGWDAVRLWQEWRRGSRAARDLLVAYNEADVRNLEPLADLLYRRLSERYDPLRSPVLPI